MSHSVFCRPGTNGASLVKKIPITGHQDFAVQTNLGVWPGQAFAATGKKNILALEKSG